MTKLKQEALLREALLLRQGLIHQIEAEGGPLPEGYGVDRQPMEEVWASLAEQYGSRLEADQAVDLLLCDIDSKVAAAALFGPPETAGRASVVVEHVSLSRGASHGVAWQHSPTATPPYQPSAAFELLRELGRGASNLVAEWGGLLKSWTPQTPVADGALAGGSVHTRYVGAEAPLESLFEPHVLDGGLAWAVGPLQVMAALDESGHIRSVRAAIGTKSSSAEGAAILLELCDETSATVALALSPERPSTVRAGVLVGNWDKLSLRAYVEQAD